MSKIQALKKEILGHENVEPADVLQMLLLMAIAALMLFIVLKLRLII